MIDLGDDIFTRGRPHPMIDPLVRDAPLRRSARGSHRPHRSARRRSRLRSASRPRGPSRRNGQWTRRCSADRRFGDRYRCRSAVARGPGPEARPRPALWSRRPTPTRRRLPSRHCQKRPLAAGQNRVPMISATTVRYPSSIGCATLRTVVPIVRCGALAHDLCRHRADLIVAAVFDRCVYLSMPAARSSVSASHRSGDGPLTLIADIATGRLSALGIHVGQPAQADCWSIRVGDSIAFAINNAPSGVSPHGPPCRRSTNWRISRR